MTATKDGLSSGYYVKPGEKEHERFFRLKKRMQRIKNVYLGIAAILVIVALAVGFTIDRNLGLIVVIIAALIVFAGAMYVYYVYKKEMG
jgi:hypothetical protein